MTVKFILKTQACKELEFAEKNMEGKTKIAKSARKDCLSCPEKIASWKNEVIEGKILCPSNNSSALPDADGHGGF